MSYLDALRDAACDRNGCWCECDLTDAQVTATLGAGWQCFRLDDHFSGKAHRLPKGKRVGGMCDGVAAHPRKKNVRLVEVKAGPHLKAAQDQLGKGAAWVLKASTIPPDALTAECHFRAAPRSSFRPKPISVPGLKVRLPFSIWSGGEKII